MSGVRHGIRRLRLEVDLEIDGRVPLPDGYIVEALADALPEIDAQGLLFPGVDWPRHRERLRDWSVRLTSAGGRHALPALEAAVEQRRREGDLGQRHGAASPAEAELRAQADDLLAAIDECEPVMMERAKAAWQTVVRLRHLAAQFDMPATNPTGLRATIADAREFLTRCFPPAPRRDGS